MTHHSFMKNPPSSSASSNSQSQRIVRSRRRFLQLTGATALTFPFLRALPGYAQADAPRYLALTLKGNGVVRHTFGADKTGEGVGQIQFRPTLAPLAGFEQYVTVVNGLKGEAATTAGGTHEGGMASLWTGRASQMGPGASIDQIVASTSTGTPRRSLEFRALSPNDEFVKTPNNRMIFDASGTPLDPREDSAAAFDQLFAGVSGDTEMEEDPNRTRRTLLFSHIDTQLAGLQPKLCNEDRVHLDALRAGWNDLGASLSQVIQCDPQDPSSITADSMIRTSSRQMIELLVMSFACDITHVGSMQWSQGRSDFKADFLGISEAHHDLSHAQPQAHTFEHYIAYPEDRWETSIDNPSAEELAAHADIWNKLNTIDTFYMEEFAYFLDRLRAFPSAAGGTLLDQALVVFGTEIDNGSGHDHYNMPYLLAGGAGGRLNRGTVVNYPVTSQRIEQDDGKPPGLRYHNDLLVTIAHLMGQTGVSSVGEASYNQGPLAELIV